MSDECLHFCLCTVFNYLHREAVASTEANGPGTFPSFLFCCSLFFLRVCADDSRICATSEVESKPPQAISCPKKTATLQCARHRAVVVSYVAVQDQTILGNAAIDGSVYVSLIIIIMPLRHAVKMPPEICSLKRSVKKKGNRY